jgi:hypothetical protein
MTSSLDARLRNLLQAIDTSPGFDERVMARVRAESDAAAERRAAKARAEEIERYELARRRHSWGAWVRRLPTLDVLGVAVLSAIVARALWVPLASGATAEFLAMYAFQILTGIGALLVLAPLPALLLLRRRAAE